MVTAADFKLIFPKSASSDDSSSGSGAPASIDISDTYGRISSVVKSATSSSSSGTTSEGTGTTTSETSETGTNSTVNSLSNAVFGESKGGIMTEVGGRVFETLGFG